MKLKLFVTNPLCGLATSGWLGSVGLLYGVLSTRVACPGTLIGIRPESPRCRRWPEAALWGDLFWNLAQGYF